MFSAEQLAVMMALFLNPLVGAATAAVGAIGGLLGCAVGWKQVEKHFVRSGLVAWAA